VAIFVALLPLQGLPHVSDEIAYTLQSRLFAAGMRTGPPADEPSMLAYPFWQASPRSFAVFPPGWPALLALGEALDLPFLVNPLTGAGLVILIFWIGRELSSDADARFAAWLVALSPGFFLLSASRMAHTSVLAGLALLALVVLRGRDRPWAWLLAGLGGAYAVAARPFDALLVGGPLLLWGMFQAPSWRARLPLLVLPGLASLWILADNHALTGSFHVFPVDAWYDAWVADAGRPPGCNRLGFGPDIGCVPVLGSWGHSPLKALRLSSEGLLRLDRLLLGVPCGALLALGGLLLARSRRCLLLTAIALLPLLGYALYWSPGLAYGARFYHLAYLVLPLGLAMALGFLARSWRWLFLAVPLLASVPLLRDLGDRYWCVDASFERGIEALGIEEGVLFLQGRGRRSTSWPALGVRDFVCDPMLESGNALLLLDPSRPSGGLQPRHDPVDPASRSLFLRRFHPDAPAWLVEHDIGEDRYRISPWEAPPEE
jgi:hypothetical protein